MLSIKEEDMIMNPTAGTKGLLTIIEFVNKSKQTPCLLIIMVSLFNKQ